MNRHYHKILIAIICVGMSACHKPNLHTREKESNKEQDKLLEQMHIFDLDNFYLQPDIAIATQQATALLLRKRSVISCSDKNVRNQ